MLIKKEGDYPGWAWLKLGEPSKKGGLGPFPKSDSPASLEAANCLEFYSCQEIDSTIWAWKAALTFWAMALAETWLTPYEVLSTGSS